MSIDRIRMIVGFSIICSHLITYIILLFFLGLAVAEKQEMSLLVTPIFSVYVISIAKRFLTTTPWEGTVPHPNFTILALGAGILFAVAVPVTVSLFGSNSIPTFSELKIYVGILESVLGLYTGLVIETLFGTYSVTKNSN